MRQPTTTGPTAPNTLPVKELSDAERYHRVRRVLLQMMILNLLLTFAKVFVGLLTGALAMVADGFHSAMDAAANLIGIAGTSLAAQPPDEDHPYGHRRFETMATLAIGSLLLLAAWEILKSALDRLFNGGKTVITPISFAVMIGTIAFNLFAILYERRSAKRWNSDVLKTDALEKQLDLSISLSVLVGLVATALGFPWMDAVIALLIVALILRTAFDILRRTTGILVDAAAVNPAEVSRVIASVPGVDSTLRVRSRGPADTIFVDADVQVEPATTADRASAIEDEIQKRIKAAFTGVSEVQIHFVPHHDQPPNPALIARAAADALGLSVHEITEIHTSRGAVLEMHVEVPPTLTLAAAHEKVTELESRVVAALPEIADVVTHIEPTSDQTGMVFQTAAAAQQRDRALAIATQLYPDAYWHDATIRPVSGGYAMTVHCWLPGSVSVQEAHAIAEQVETQIRAAMPQFQRVTIHTEPPEDDAQIAKNPPKNNTITKTDRI